MIYTPDTWVIIKVTTPEEVIYKTFGGWYDGYLVGDSWRMNSGITEVIDDDDSWDFVGYSGSHYVCRKNTEEMSAYQATILAEFQDQLFGEYEIEVVPVEEILGMVR